MLQLFLTGLAGGCAIVGALCDWSGHPATAALAQRARRWALVVALAAFALPLAAAGQPLRTWHVLAASARPWSYYWLQAWLLLGFVAVLIVALALRTRAAALVRVALSPGLALLGAALSAGVGAIPALGALAPPALAASSVAMGVAAVGLGPVDPGARARLAQAACWTLVAMLATMATALVSGTALQPMGATASGTTGAVALLAGAVTLGALAPLGLYQRPAWLGPAHPLLTSLLTLVGGLALRAGLALLNG